MNMVCHFFLVTIKLWFTLFVSVIFPRALTIFVFNSVPSCISYAFRIFCVNFLNGKVSKRLSVMDILVFRMNVPLAVQ